MVIVCRTVPAVWLVGVYWRTRTVLGALLAANAVALAAFAAASDPTGSYGKAAPAVAVIVVIVAVVR